MSEEHRGISAPKLNDEMLNLVKEEVSQLSKIEIMECLTKNGISSLDDLVDGYMDLVKAPGDVTPMRSHFLYSHFCYKVEFTINDEILSKLKSKAAKE